MNHRQRVQTALRHREPDRLPVDLGGMRSTGIMAIAYQGLKQVLGVASGELQVFDTGQQLAFVEEPIRQRFGCDVVILDGGLVHGWQPYTLPDGTKAQISGDFRWEDDGKGGQYALDETGRRTGYRPADSLYFDPIYHPLAEATSLDDLERYDWGTLKDEDLALLRKEARRLYEQTDYAILGSFGGNFLESGQGLRGWDTFMMDLAGDLPFAEAILDHLLATHLHNVELYLDAVGDYIQIIQMGDDMGTQSGPQLRPKLYYDVLQPRQKVLWSRIHALKPEVAVFLHCCGGVYELLPGIIEAGCDVINPVQISAAGMQPERLKSEFGDRLSFWGGGCDTQNILPFASPDEVYAHTRRNIEIFKPGGGFIFCQVHNIQAGVPTENILAMYQAVQDCWTYP